MLLEQRLALLENPAPDWVSSSPTPCTTKQDAHAKDVLVRDSRVALALPANAAAKPRLPVHAVQDATQALALLDRQAFSLVFLDIELGDGPMNGWPCAST